MDCENQILTSLVMQSFLMGLQATVNAKEEREKWKKDVPKGSMILATQRVKVSYSKLKFL